MSEASPSVKAEDNTPKAVKDKNCPYCGQAFTSSSLGRHLDLYVKERNPKKQDGIHDVDEIRRMRGGITRRHPKGSSRRRNTITPAGTPSAGQRKANISGDESSNAPSPAVGGPAHASVGTSDADIASMFPLGGVRWEATGVINEALVASPDGNSGADGGHSGDGSHPAPGLDTRGFNPNRRPIVSRVVSRQAVKAELDSRQKIQDALDDARAAELALREFTNAWRAAKQQIEMGSMPFDFDPLTMNFPALTLQCLRAQPTLFASTQLPTPASWSTTPPGASQFEALKSFFKEEFRRWRVKCAAATTAQYEDIKYPPSPEFQHLDRREAIERAERSADALEQEASKHLEVAFHAWDELPRERQNELWILELARGVATKQTEIDKLKEAQSDLRQEASSLKIQIEQLNRLQQPREFKLVPPAHIPMNEKILFELQDAAVSQGSRGVGLNINDRHSDLSTIVAAAIGRWKNVIVSTRASGSGMGAQRPLGSTLTATGSVTSPTAGAANQAVHAPPVATPTTPSLRSPKQAQKALRSVPQPPAREPVPSARPAAPSATSSTPAQPTTKPTTKPTSRPQVQTLVPGHAAAKSGDSSRDKKRPTVEDQNKADEDEDEGEEEGEGGDEEEEEEEEVDDDAGVDDVDGDNLTSSKPVTQISANPAPASMVADENSQDDDSDDENEETSDKDADAEMEDGDEFAHMHTPISRGISAAGEASDAQIPQTANQLKTPKTRTAAQQIPRTTGASGVGLINASGSMPSINVPIHGHSAGHHMTADMISMNTIGGDAMYMD